MLSTSERHVLKAFERFLMSPGQMLCFYGPDLKKHKPALGQLIEKGFLVKEKFNGAYSLTQAGFNAMQDGA